LEYLGLRNKPKAEVHPGHKLTGPKEEEEEEKEEEEEPGLLNMIVFVKHNLIYSLINWLHVSTL